MDERWLKSSGSQAEDAALAARITQLYPDLGPVVARHVYSSVHDIVHVDSDLGAFALKVYRSGVRTIDDVRWEIDLHRHLAAAGAPVPRLVEGVDGFVAKVELAGQRRWSVLSEWAPGERPPPSTATYRLLGRAAAVLHAATEDFHSNYDRPPRTISSEVDQYLALLRPALDRIGRWGEVAALGRLVSQALRRGLERGVCHNDLTLDNIHVERERLTVFDLDSAGETWRAWEPQGVFHFSVLTGEPWWEDWLAGYETIRPMADRDQEAVPYFVLMAHFENAAWKLALTPTSVGQLLSEAELPDLVDIWIDWAETHCVTP